MLGSVAATRACASAALGAMASSDRAVMKARISGGSSRRSRRRPSSAAGGGDAAVDVEQVAGALAGAVLGREVQRRLGDVVRQDAHLERVALAVVLVELLGIDVVGRRALLAPRRAPDLRPLQHGVGIDGVDADPVRAALLREAAGEVQLGGLGGGVGRGVLAGDERVLGGDEDDRAAGAL